MWTTLDSRTLFCLHGPIHLSVLSTFLCFCACLPVFRHQGVHVGMLTNMSDRKALNVFKSVYLSLVNLSMMFHSFRGQTLCTIAAVLGGKSLAAQISEKIVSRELESTDLFILVTVVASNLWHPFSFPFCRLHSRVEFFLLFLGFNPSFQRLIHDAYNLGNG